MAFPSLLPYLAILAVLGAAALAVAAVWHSRLAAPIAVIAWGLLAVVAAVATESRNFALAQLLGWALFLALPLLLLATAIVVVRREKLIAAASVSVAVIVSLVGIDAVFIEPQWLQVNRVVLTSPKVSEPLRIAVLADFQADVIGPYETRVVRTLAEQDADLILLPGDYVQVRTQAARDVEGAQFQALLREARLAPRYGAFAVGGDVERSGWQSIFDGTGIMALGDRTSFDTGPVAITALPRVDSFETNLVVEGQERFHVVVGHGPDYALGEIDADLLLAGHVHGGQVRLPIIGPLITLSAVPRAWAAGVTDIGAGRTLVVSRGTGMERGDAPRLRFLCRPEIVVIDIVPGETPGLDTRGQSILTRALTRLRIAP